MQSAANNSNENTAVGLRIYLDFDGTLTPRPGSGTVGHPFYKSLQTNPRQRYVEATYQENMVDAIRDKFANDEDIKGKFAVSPEAIQFLSRMIDKGAEVIILSKNRKEYIEANLVASGLDRDKVEEIECHDVFEIDDRDRPETLGKNRMIISLEKQKGAAVTVLFCDDDFEDNLKMNEALASYGDKKEGYYKQPGQFKWAEIETSILARHENNMQRAKERSATAAQDGRLFTQPPTLPMQEAAPKPTDDPSQKNSGGL